MTHVLAIDQSTSATKAVLFDAAGQVIDRTLRDLRPTYPQPGWVEFDAEEIWQNVLIVLRELATRNRALSAAAKALAITNQRETFVVFDRQAGQPLYKAIGWQCRRGEPGCQKLRNAGHEETVRRKTGLKLDTYFSGSKLQWLIREKEEIRQRLESGDALVGTIDTYLIYRLTKTEVFATDPTNASRTLLYDIGRLRWDEQLCSLFDVPVRSLAEVRESFHEFGATSAEGALPSELCIRGVMGDSQASMFAQGCHERGSGKVTFGSGTSVLVNTGDRFETSALGSVAALAWVCHGRPTFALEGIINYSSATIAWLRDQLGLIDDALETAAVAQAVEDNGGVYFVPAFGGLNAPYWSPNARAAIVGMTAYSTKAHIVRAALEAIAYQIRDALESMCMNGSAPRVLYVDGRPTSNEFLMQFTADIIRSELVVADVPESSARGAALAAMLGLGDVGSWAEMASMSREVRRYRPTMDARLAEQLYTGWKTAVNRVL